MFVLLQGEFQARGDLAGDTFVISLKRGDVTGLLPFSRMKQFTINMRALTDGRVLRFPATLFPELVQKMPELATRLVGSMSGPHPRNHAARAARTGWPRWASFPPDSPTNSTIPPRPPSAPPASCAPSEKNSRRQPRTRPARANCGAASRDRRSAEAALTQQNEPPPNPLAASELEDRLDSLLRSHGQKDMWQLAAGLAQKNAQPAVPVSVVHNSG